MTGPGRIAGSEAAADGIARSARALGDWVFGLALPFWSTIGMDPPLGEGRGRAACEHLQLDGRPAEPGYRRMRVQARQLYVFTEAAANGVDGAADIAAGIHRFMTAQGAAAEGGWARRLRPDGSVLDPTNDLYDLAFVLFGLAHHARLTGDPAPLRQADRTLGFLRRRMARPSGGFANAEPAEPGWRQQNPHMHLLEAALELFSACGDGRWAELAVELVALFRTRLLEPDTGTLGEYFDEDWRRAPGIDGEKVEPGHHAEWIWLLERHQALTGEDTAALIAPLDALCRRHGIGAETGLVRDEVGRDGALRLGSARLWPQGETVKAHCALVRMALARHDAAAARAHEAVIVRSAGNLLTRYLVAEEGGLMPPGTWIDRLDPFGRPAIDRIPTSSFYHIMSAWAELDRLRRRGGS